MLGTAAAESKDVVPAALAGSVELAQQVVNKLKKELASTRSKKQEERKNFAAALTKKLQDEEVIKIFFKRHNVDYKGDIADSIEESTSELVKLHKNGTGNQATGLLDYRKYGKAYVACVARIQKLTGEIAEAHVAFENARAKVAFENARAKVQAAIEEAKSKTWLGTLQGQYMAKIMEEIKELRKDNQEFRHTLAEQSKQIAFLLKMMPQPTAAAPTVATVATAATVATVAPDATAATAESSIRTRTAKKKIGVYKTPSKRWAAKLYHNGTSRHIATFPTRAEARAAYDAAATAAAAETRRKRKRASDSQTQPPATTATAVAAETRCKRKRVSDSQTQPATTATAAQTLSSLFLM